MVIWPMSTKQPGVEDQRVLGYLKAILPDLERFTLACSAFCRVRETHQVFAGDEDGVFHTPYEDRNTGLITALVSSTGTDRA
jgi:hypothetical protein